MTRPRDTVGSSVLVLLGLFLLAAVFTQPAQGAESPLATVTSTGAATTYVSTNGAALSVQCPGQQIRYRAGSAGSPPTAAQTSVLLDFVADPNARPIQLAGSEDRISFIRAPTAGSFTCYVYAQSSPPVTPTSLTNCLSIKHSVVAVGADGGTFAVPASPQAGRRYAELCVSAENSGSPKVKCATDPAAGKPQLGLAEPGNVLQIGVQPCVTYFLDSTHPIACVADTAGTAVTCDECVSP